MNIIYPKLSSSQLPAMIGYALLGALVAGFYGIIHDQVTYSISPEYFTRLKFEQFRYADFGLAPRVFVAEIGFLATWWVGFIAGWLLARVVVPACPPARARGRISAGFAIILSCALAASLLGFALGLLRSPNVGYAAWQGVVTAHGIVDVSSFVRVAYIHNASYLGGFGGLVVALIYLRRVRTASIQN